MSKMAFVLDDGFEDFLGGGPCIHCKHWRAAQGTKCDAFPDGIPVQIWTGKHDHETPYPGDHGILYEPAEERAPVKA